MSALTTYDCIINDNYVSTSFYILLLFSSIVFRGSEVTHVARNDNILNENLIDFKKMAFKRF